MFHTMKSGETMFICSLEKVPRTFALELFKEEKIKQNKRGFEIIVDNKK